MGGSREPNESIFASILYFSQSYKVDLNIECTYNGCHSTSGLQMIDDDAITVSGGSVTSNSSAPVVFVCSISQTGDLIKSERAVDGIFGFGQQSMSISQLSSQGPL
ncbi:Eukaryotic aspartyl protease family protein [Euphorbia peplus]|nr:Eukaryotic aspartyl protease family protein [Euphorbia peplus]